MYNPKTSAKSVVEVSGLSVPSPGRFIPTTYSTGGFVGLRPVWMGTKNFAPTGIRHPDTSP
jgi:hypothetical protein